jgi:large subunit ribosomal protein L31e
MAKTLERTYNVPLRKGTQKVPNWRRTKKTVKVLREFLSKHMKSDNVKISKELNQELWKHGIKNPPHHVKVNVKKGEDGITHAQLFGVKEAPKAQIKKKSIADKLKDKVKEVKK